MPDFLRQSLLFGSILLLAATACSPADAAPDEADPTNPAGTAPTSQPAGEVKPPEAKPATKIEHVDAQGAAKLIKDHADLVVLDVRRPQEFAAGHIEGAVNVDFFGEDFASGLKQLDPTKPTLVHCKSGGRSTKALDTIQQLGFAHVFHLDGGMMGWQEAKLPTVQ